MKKAIVLLILCLAGGGWVANKFVQRSSKNTEEFERMAEHATNYGYDAEIFITDQLEKHHDDAFDSAYRMWKLSPVSELDLSTRYDEKVYFETLGKTIAQSAKEQGQTDAYAAIIDIGKFYGMEPKNDPRTPPPATNKPATKPDSESSLGKPKLGDKRTVPGRRDRDR